MTDEAERLARQELLIASVRLAAVAWAVTEVGFVARDYPPGYERWAWITTAVLAVGAAVFLLLARRPRTPRAQTVHGIVATVFDTLVVYAFVFIYAFEPGTPAWGLRVLPVIEAAVRFGVWGGVLLPFLALPLNAGAELFRADRFPPFEFEPRFVTLPLGVQLVTGLIVGGLVRQLWGQAAVAEERAAEAEALRDEIGRHADQLEVVNRCARALSSSLELDDAFRQFVREARTAISFDRLALVLAQNGRAEIIANVGVDADTLWPAGTWQPIEGSVVEHLLATSQTIVMRDMEDSPVYPEDRKLAEAGLRSRVAAPLTVAGRTLGMISLSRRERDAFSQDEIELVTLLGRQVATAVENIRAFEAERSAVEELRRLTALRADFVSLVSHELRGPMASVIGASATLRQRWRTLAPEQRESFLGLIEGETARLADLIGDVLDTSRIDAGTFSYSFGDVDVGELVREVAAVVDIGAEEIGVRADVAPSLPVVRGDADRLRQLLMNLVTNAVKYTITGDEVQVRATAENSAVSVSVTDHGPGISPDDQRLIFERFGRAATASSKPGTGLGLFIARSIAEAHGGSLEVRSQRGEGATFVVRLPVLDA